MDINKYFDENRKPDGMMWRCPKIKCADGFTLSVQASNFHYCTPREDSGPYLEVEIGFPSAKEDLIMEYAEDENDPTDTVYGWVPIDIVEQVIENHGGMV